MKNEVRESTDVSDTPIKELLSQEENKRRTNTHFLEKQVINHLKSQDISFSVPGNSKTQIKQSNGCCVASNNHKESDTLVCYCLRLVHLCETDVFTIVLGKYEKLDGLTLLIAWSNKNG